MHMRELDQIALGIKTIKSIANYEIYRKVLLTGKSPEIPW
tara:strand:- start:132 stop:251 length:120 start_codon:yes stop_codon:yes gene_type:complete